MFEEQILEALKTRFQGVDAKTLARIAKTLAKKVKTEDEVQTAADGVTIQQLMENYGDSRATEATNSAVTNYEKKHGLKDGKPVTQEPEPNPGKEGQQGQKPGADDNTPEWAKKLLSTNEALQKRIDALETEKRQSTRKDKLAKALEKAPEKIRTRYQSDFERMTFKDDEDFDSYIEGLTTQSEEWSNEFSAPGKPGKTTPPKGGGSGSGTISPELQARIDARKAETSAPAIIGLTPESK
ncbi:MAG: hypothetical protein MJZ26_09085 [Fibrobacter sp.]|nr:hypothetical protein [Fibrobacter sp.]